MSAGKYALDPGLRAMLVDLGMRPAKVLSKAGLRADALAGGSVWLTQDEFFALWRAIESESSNPNLPLLIEHAFAPGVFAPVIFAAMMSPDLNTAALRIATYKKLIGPMRLKVDVTEASTTISHVWPDDAECPATLVLSELLFWVAMARVGTRHRVEPVRVCAPKPPLDSEAYRAYLGVTIAPSRSQSQAQAIVFTAEDAARPFLTANAAIWETFEPELRRRLNALEVDAAVSDRVRAVLLELLPAGRTTVADVARELAMSTRTLHRRLKTETQSFQSILDATREALARHYLTRPNLSAPDISFLLGYEQISSFYRAFHRWTGQSPERARRLPAP